MQFHHLLQHKASAWRSFYYLPIIITSFWWTRSISMCIGCLSVWLLLCHCLLLFCSFVFSSISVCLLPSSFDHFLFALLCIALLNLMYLPVVLLEKIGAGQQQWLTDLYVLLPVAVVIYVYESHMEVSNLWMDLCLPYAGAHKERHMLVYKWIFYFLLLPQKWQLIISSTTVIAMTAREDVAMVTPMYHTCTVTLNTWEHSS